MRLSPAQRHLLRHAAAKAAPVPENAPAPDRDDKDPSAAAYQLLRAQLDEHLRQLSDIKSVERKIDAKRQMIATYKDHVRDVLAVTAETGTAQQDEILVTIMIWSLDTGAFDDALDLAQHVLKYRLTLPQRYNRDAPTLIAEEVAEAALTAFKTGGTFPLAPLKRAEDLTADRDINDIVRAKLQKALGLAWRAYADAIEPGADGPAGGKRAALEQAEAHLKRAQQLHDKAGVVKLIEDIVRQLAKEPPVTAS